jgi:DNA-binding MarR family transcriptional regulator
MKGRTMNEAAKSLAQLKKANKLVRLAFHKNGPKSYKRGQGALLRALLENDGAPQRELVKTLGMNRSNLKDVVKKAQRNEYVTIESVDEPRTYAVKLTDLGRELAEKRVAANDRTADEILSCLTAEEVKQLDAITEKLIVAMKEKGISGKKKGYKVRRKKHRR